MSRFKPTLVERKIDEFRPDILAYSFTSDQAWLAKEYMKHFSSRDIFSIAGGIHPTVAPEDISPYVDGVCIGEGEGPILDLVRGREPSTIKNLWIRKNETVVKNAPRPLIEDLDSYPFSDRELFNYQRSLNEDHRADFLVGRGCPFCCTYCINNRLHKLAPGRYVRLRSVKNAIDEIKEVTSQYNAIESICFQDDTFALKKSWLSEFCLAYKREIDLPFACNLRVGVADQESIEMLAYAGCNEVRVGVEQGNEKLRRTVLKRKMTNQQIIKTFNCLKKVGINVFAYNMIGIPGETEDKIQDTINLNRKLDSDKMHVSIFRPYPGTELYDHCVENNYLHDIKIESYFEPISSLEMPSISKDKIEYYYRIFRTAVYFPKLLPFVSLLAKIKMSRTYTLYDMAFNIAYTTFRFVRKSLPIWLKKPLFKFLKL
jgi:anaerobic magnesium-protoporphyrin IX monomethyl ester cyclase